MCLLVFECKLVISIKISQINFFSTKSLILKFHNFKNNKINNWILNWWKGVEWRVWTQKSYASKLNTGLYKKRWNWDWKNNKTEYNQRAKIN